LTFLTLLLTSININNNSASLIVIFLSCMKAGRGAEVLLKQNYY
jgi:hypothetical protein